LNTTGSKTKTAGALGEPWRIQVHRGKIAAFLKRVVNQGCCSTRFQKLNCIVLKVIVAHFFLFPYPRVERDEQNTSLCRL